MSCVQQPEQLNDHWRSYTSAGTGTVSLYGEEKQMTTSSGTYVGIDVSKDRLDVAMLGEKQEKQIGNTLEGINELVKWMVEATGGYQRRVVDALFQSGLAVAMVNPMRARQFA